MAKLNSKASIFGMSFLRASVSEIIQNPKPYNSK